MHINSPVLFFLLYILFFYIFSLNSHCSHKLCDDIYYTINIYNMLFFIQFYDGNRVCIFVLAILFCVILSSTRSHHLFIHSIKTIHICIHHSFSQLLQLYHSSCLYFTDMYLTMFVCGSMYFRVCISICCIVCCVLCAKI